MVAAWAVHRATAHRMSTRSVSVERSFPLLESLARGAPLGRILVVVAHPDDETILAGAALADRSDVWIVHLTDGVPRDASRARQAGAPDPEAYAALRRHELDAALRVLGLEGAGRIALGAPEGEAIEHLTRLADAVSRALATVRPELVLAHAYDGGHPDHDAAAFVVRAALARARSAAVLVDLAGHHEAEAGRPGVGFLPREGTSLERALDGEAARRKRLALECFGTRAQVIAGLETDVERFRIGAREDFSRPPHEGPLRYERLGGSVDGERFRARVAQAAGALDLPAALP